MYIAEIFTRGRKVFQGVPHADRNEAARYAFRNGPANAKECSTAGAYRDPSGNWRSNGMDIRWHKRHDFMRETAPCDVGMFGDGAKQASLF